ncbi:MAG: twin-arginine translocase subunit TatC [Actinomycetota bacterium]
MTVIEHLDELRYRLVISIVAFVVGSIIAYVVYKPVLQFLKAPLDEAVRNGAVGSEVRGELDLYVTGIATGFIIRIKASAFAGLIFALPVILYQFWRFITPGLEPRERKFAVPFVLSALALFALGAYVAFLILPLGIKFLLGFVSPAQPLIHLTEYLSFVFLMILAFGATFEFPLVLVFLAMADILTSRQLRKARRAAFFIAFVVAAVATPSGDPLSQTVMAVPLYVLYEASILVIRFGLKK